MLDPMVDSCVIHNVNLQNVGDDRNPPAPEWFQILWILWWKMSQWAAAELGLSRRERFWRRHRQTVCCPAAETSSLLLEVGPPFLYNYLSAKVDLFKWAHREKDPVWWLFEAEGFWRGEEIILYSTKFLLILDILWYNENNIWDK